MFNVPDNEIIFVALLLFVLHSLMPLQPFQPLCYCPSFISPPQSALSSQIPLFLSLPYHAPSHVPSFSHDYPALVSLLKIVSGPLLLPSLPPLRLFYCQRLTKAFGTPPHHYYTVWSTVKAGFRLLKLPVTTIPPFVSASKIVYGSLALASKQVSVHLPVTMRLQLHTLQVIIGSPLITLLQIVLQSCRSIFQPPSSFSNIHETCPAHHRSHQNDSVA